MTTGVVESEITKKQVIYSDELVRHKRPGFWDLTCWHRKFLVYNLVARNLKVRYRGSFLGLFWTVLIPALNALVYLAIFQFVMKVRIEHYLLFVLSGVVPWTFFSSAILTAMESLVGNHSILNKVPIPPYSFPLGEVLTAFLNLIAGLPVILIVLFASGGPWSATFLLVPFLLCLLLIQSYGFGLLLAYLCVYFRDLRHLMIIVVQIWFYLTPIIYAPSMIPEKFRWLMIFNPVGHIFEGLHGLVLGYPFEIDWFLVPMVWSVIIVAVGYASVRRWNARVVESV